MKNNHDNTTDHCRIEYHEHTVPMEEYLRDCVDVPKFLSYCRRCSNFGKTWSCPDFAFDPVDFWKKFRSLKVIGMKIIIPEKMREKKLETEDINRFVMDFLETYKVEFDDYILEKEKEEGGTGLNGGSCHRCHPLPCSRQDGQACRQPDKMRYSIEALGGNVSLTVTKYLSQTLEWVNDGILPTHFMLVGGVLIPPESH